MAKISKCPVCKSDIEKHKITQALECVNALELQKEKITSDNAFAAGYKHGNLKGQGQKHADKNVFTLNIKGKQVVTIEPALVILRDILKQNLVKEKDDGNEEGKLPAGSGSLPESSETPAP